jgi:hypothetical protein
VKGIDFWMKYFGILCYTLLQDIQVTIKINPRVSFDFNTSGSCKDYFLFEFERLIEVTASLISPIKMLNRPVHVGIIYKTSCILFTDGNKDENL